MMYVIRFLTISAILSILSGCAVDRQATQISGLGLVYLSDIKYISDDTYYVEAEAAPAAGRIGGAKGAAFKEATSFCSRKNKGIKVVDLKEDSHLLVNGVVKMTFNCV